MKLYLDDERIEPPGWLRVSTAENCIDILLAYAGHITVLSLDHDLDSHVDTRKLGYATLTPMTGYDVAVWLEKEAYHGNWDVVPAELRCHSQNPAGHKRILQCFAQINFRRP